MNTPAEWELMGYAILGLAVIVAMGWVAAYMLSAFESDLQSDFDTITERNRR